MLTITSNHHWRPVLCWHDLTPNEQLEFDGELDCEYFYQDSFYRYKGLVYPLGDFMPVGEVSQLAGKGWEAYYSSSWWSGVVIRHSEDGEYYQIGSYLEKD